MRNLGYRLHYEDLLHSLLNANARFGGHEQVVSGRNDPCAMLLHLGRETPSLPTQLADFGMDVGIGR